jgi:hypothetical protein
VYTVRRELSVLTLAVKKIAIRKVFAGASVTTLVVLLGHDGTQFLPFS